VTTPVSAPLPSVRVHVVERGGHARAGWQKCEIGANVEFNTRTLESYFFAEWKPELFDAFLLAGSVEFCDRTLRRPSIGWTRSVALHVPMHDSESWKRSKVVDALHSALEFLTGDRWQVTFYKRRRSEDPPRQNLMDLSQDVSAVMPFSDGLDSRAVAGLLSRQLGNQLVRVRLGTKKFDTQGAKQREPFTSVPYRIRPRTGFPESSARSRGFKFALLSVIAANLAKADKVIVPESGQGALGPSLVPVGQAYPDYRSHPLFTEKMERLALAIFGREIKFDFPQLWYTKGETLKRFVEECGETSSAWSRTWSCWQQNRQVSVNHKKRQCGICAACMLRRMSVHAAGLSERPTAYVWENLSASGFIAGAAASFSRTKITNAMREYAIAGALHMDHLATLQSSAANASSLNLAAFLLSKPCKLAEAEVRLRLGKMLSQHETEWRAFVNSMGRDAFMTKWTAMAA
jgi:7-cyano-7-deazaguanine synthase in queuosine biosynthesis